MADLITLGAAVASDVLSAFQIAGGATLAEIAKAHVDKKRAEAAELLIEQLQSGVHGPIEFNQDDLDPMIEIIYRFSKAVADGAARENLCLLAQVIAGLKKYKALDPDAFRKWCGTLETLTRDELILLGKAYRIAVSLEQGNETFWKSLYERMIGSGYSKEEVLCLATSLSRTGLLLPKSAWGGIIYESTPWLIELGTLAVLDGR